MGLRPSRCYKWDSPAYTRTSNNPQDSFITGIPGSKIIHYNMGNLKGDFEVETSIIAKDRIQVRHNALEATRTAVNRKLEKALGRMGYHFKIRVYPHHVMRENVMATGAGADRVQSGMRGSFGKPIGRAARVNRGQAVLSVYTMNEERDLRIVKETLKMGVKKLPGNLEVVVRENEA
ncbi:MAG: 50S ribosomal protein L16 [Candidatus Altiarchaeota archaeon]|nr:50S ribosomal protein L16 [Candidatus Altiarchaeota archaeon]